MLLEAQLLFAGAGRDGHLAVVAELLDETATSIGLLDLHREVALEPFGGENQGEQWTPALNELAEGAWIVAPVSHEVVFEVDPSVMWDHVLRSLGIEPSTLVATRGVH